MFTDTGTDTGGRVRSRFDTTKEGMLLLDFVDPKTRQLV